METKIKLNKRDVIKVLIEDENGNDTGNYLEFDLQDISLPLRYQQMIEEHKKNKNYLTMSFALIDKKPNHEGKKALSSNDEEKFKVVNEFYRREMKILDLVLGEGGTEKILNGRKPYYEMFDDIVEYLEPLSDIFDKSYKNIKERIVNKYKDTKLEDDNTLELLEDE